MIIHKKRKSDKRDFGWRRRQATEYLDGPWPLREEYGSKETMSYFGRIGKSDIRVDVTWNEVLRLIEEYARKNKDVRAIRILKLLRASQVEEHMSKEAKS